MANEFDNALSEITGVSLAAAPENQQEQAQAAPAESNAFDQALADRVQEATPSPERSPDMPEPGGGMDR